MAVGESSLFCSGALDQERGISQPLRVWRAQDDEYENWWIIV